MYIHLFFKSAGQLLQFYFEDYLQTFSYFDVENIIVCFLWTETERSNCKDICTCPKVKQKRVVTKNKWKCCN